MRIAFVTAGTVGAGHLTRGAAVARAFARARRAGDDDVVRVFSPPSPFAERVRGVADVVEVPVEVPLLRDPRTAPDSALARAIAAFAPDIVLIDVFWVPLVFVPLPCPAWLLLRSVPPRWLVGPTEAPFSPRRYARVLAIEPAPALSNFEAIPPVVVSNPDERGPRRLLASVLGVSEGRPLRVIVRAGAPADEAILRQAAGPGDWRRLSLDAAGAPFPAAPLLAATDDGDVIVAAPGYNTFWEARFLGYASRTRFVPVPRPIDDTAWRASLPASVVPRENGADVLVGLLRRG